MAGVREVLRGTMSTLFQIGKRGHQWKFGDTDTVGQVGLEARDENDAAYCRVRGADPANDRDFVTLAYFNANNATSVNVACAKVDIGTSSLTTVGSIPSGARVVEARLIITTPYSSGGTIAATLTGGDSLLTVGDNDAEEAADCMFVKRQASDVGGAAKTVDVTIGGAPGAGAACLEVYYVTCVDITT